jgi:hypothetical protein
MPPDYFAANDPSAFAIVEHMPATQAQSLLAHLHDMAHLKDIGISTLLTRELCAVGAGAEASVLFANLLSPPNVLRVSWVGACGLVVIRDCDILWRSYSIGSGVRESLEHTLQSSSVAPTERPALLHCCPEVQSAFVELQDGDLIVAGSQSLWSSLSEEQILSYVRPVKDATGYDATLAMANSTCLGSWRVDDASFIAYMLAHLGDNFANATNARPLPLLNPFSLPHPSAFVGDMTVIAASCSFAR